MFLLYLQQALRFIYVISCNQHVFALVTVCLFLISCAPQPPKPSPGHIHTEEITPVIEDDIPPPVNQVPFVPPPQPLPPLETYSVVVNNVPVDELLFALARDANLNVDIHPNISGKVTLNAIDQTVPQILERITKQVNLRYQIEDNHIIISPDLPYFRSYQVGYVNMSRESTSKVDISTQIIAELQRSANFGENSSGSGGDSSGGGQSGSGSNNSTTSIVNQSKNYLWERLQQNIISILESDLTGEETGTSEKGQAKNASVILNPESGVIMVRATHQQHQEIQKFLDQVVASVQRQVLIEATIVEVRLNDQYQAGVDWKRISGDYSYIQSLTGNNLQGPPFYAIGYNNPNSRFGDISATVRLLEQFGAVKVLSSPKLMALNNQTAVLKVVDNLVYFSIDAQLEPIQSVNNSVFTGTTYTTKYTTEINTVPVGLIMSVTPQIGEEGTVTLNIRPTISRVIEYVQDPNPDLIAADVVNKVPVIQVREVESILKINDGKVAVIGGLMQDSSDRKTDGIPVLSDIPMIGDLFTYRNDQYSKTELVIFLRPTVVREASVQQDLQKFRSFLPDASQSENTPPTGLIQP